MVFIVLAGGEEDKGKGLQRVNRQEGEGTARVHRLQSAPLPLVGLPFAQNSTKLLEYRL